MGEIINKKALAACLLCLAPVFTATAKDVKTTLSVQTYGYRGDMVYFDCLQTPLIREEFYSNEGEEHVYSFDTDKPVVMVVNGRTNFFLQPGDSLHANIRYEGKQVLPVEISGTESAVSANKLTLGVEDLRKNMRYKSQLLGCVALDIKPKARIEDSRVLLAKVKEMTAGADKSVSKAAAYITAEVEGRVYESFMEYPVMYADVRKVPVDKQDIGDYWSLMEGFKPADDDVSLSCPEYVSMLMRYCFYINEKKSKGAGETYAMPQKFEDMYAELAKFYDGDVRDAVLFTLICNYIRGGKSVERAETVISDYKKNYNKSPYYAKVLDSLMQ